jgi:hypothetical protein
MIFFQIRQCSGFMCVIKNNIKIIKIVVDNRAVFVLD